MFSTFLFAINLSNIYTDCEYARKNLYKRDKKIAAV